MITPLRGTAGSKQESMATDVQRKDLATDAGRILVKGEGTESRFARRMVIPPVH